MEDTIIVEDTNLNDIVGIKFLQNMQDFFANTMDIAIICFEHDAPISKPSNFRDFGVSCIEQSDIGRRLCQKCLEEITQRLSKEKKPIIYECPTGLTNFAIPLIFKEKNIANLIGGQILTKAPDEDAFRHVAQQLKLNEDEYIAKIKKIKIIPPKEFEIIVDSLALIANSALTIACANSQLSKLSMDYKIPKSISLEELICLSCKQPDKSLTSREFEVLKLIVMGKSNTEIAKELFISVHTAKAHVSSIIEKFKVEDRVQMAVKAVRKGLI